MNTSMNKEAIKSIMQLLLNDLFIDREINPMTVTYANVLRKKYMKSNLPCPMWVQAITNGNIAQRDALWFEVVRTFCQDYISLKES